MSHMQHKHTRQKQQVHNTSYQFRKCIGSIIGNKKKLNRNYSHRLIQKPVIWRGWVGWETGVGKFVLVSIYSPANNDPWFHMFCKWIHKFNWPNSHGFTRFCEQIWCDDTCQWNRTSTDIVHIVQNLWQFVTTCTGGAVPIMNQYDMCQLVQKWFLVCWEWPTRCTSFGKSVGWKLDLNKCEICLIGAGFLLHRKGIKPFCSELLWNN